MIYLAFPLCGLLAVASSGLAPETPVVAPQARSGWLELRLLADKPAYRLHDTIHLTALLVNTSGPPFFLQRRQLAWVEFGAGLTLRVRDAKTGREPLRERPYVADNLVIPPSSRADFVELRAQQVFGVLRTIELGDLGIREVGDWVVELEFNGTDYDSFGLRTWRKEDGPLRAAVTIAVLE